MRYLMKTFIFLIVIAKILSAQYSGYEFGKSWAEIIPKEPQADEKISQSWQVSNWYNNVKDVFSYNYDGLVTKKVTWQYKNSAWSKVERYIYSYTTDGLLNCKRRQSLNGDNSWVNASRDTFYYDPNGKNIEKRSQWWEAKDGIERWNDATRTLYSYEDNRNLKEEIMQKWDGSWINQVRYIYEYNEDSLVYVRRDEWKNESFVYMERWKYQYLDSTIVELHEYFNDHDWKSPGNTEITANYNGKHINKSFSEILKKDDNGILHWETGTKAIYEYNNFGPYQTTDYAWADNYWLPEGRITIRYNEEGLLSSWFWELYFTDTGWTNILLYLFEYDINNRFKSCIPQKWQRQNNEWINDKRDLYNYGCKTFKILDANGDLLAYTEFKLYKVDDDAPDYTEHLIGSFTTDAEGKYQFEKDSEGCYVLEGQKIKTGDKIKISKFVDWKPAAKHSVLMDTMYTIYLDNAKFDIDGFVSFDEFNENSKQKIIMDHTEFRYNLLVSIEWDAAVKYLQGVQQGFREMANYLYDVFDGQLRFNKIMIFDDRDHWLEADMRIYASNMVWPHVQQTNGIDLANSSPIEMPRKFFGDLDDNRDKSYSEYPFIAEPLKDYRTKAHEFGHYGCGFLDEYKDIQGIALPGNINHGFMNSQYVSSGIYSSEMSSKAVYEKLTKSTRQYQIYGCSCWDFWEKQEGNRGIDNIFVPIIKPDERNLAENKEYMPGPNEMDEDDYDFSLDYDVGCKILFPIQIHEPFAAPVRIQVFTTMFGGVERPVENAEVVLEKFLIDNSRLRINQGKPSKKYPGKIWVLGAADGDVIKAQSYQYRILNSSIPKNNSDRFNWLYCIANLDSLLIEANQKSNNNSDDDIIKIHLKEVEGNYPCICSIECSDYGYIYRLTTQNNFNQNPSLTVSALSGQINSYNFVSGPNEYTAQIADDFSENGEFTIWAVDENNSKFFFNTDFKTVVSDSLFNIKDALSADNRAVINFLDDIAIEKVIVLSSPYPIIMTGLDPKAIQVTDSYSFSIYPMNEADSSGKLMTLHYDKVYQSEADDFYDSEESIRIFKWDDEKTKWNLIGGYVDTLRNEVTVNIFGQGVYAAFTTDFVQDIEKEQEEIPQQFKLEQNYPNPFNPKTTIRYALPKAAHIQIEVYNILGQKVAEVLNENKLAGNHEISFDVSQLSSGIYFYKITAGKFSAVRKMILMK